MHWQIARRRRRLNKLVIIVLGERVTVDPVCTREETPALPLPRPLGLLNEGFHKFPAAKVFLVRLRLQRVTGCREEVEPDYEGWNKV